MCFFISMPVLAQTQNISGTIKDVLGEPIIGASILVENTQNGVISDVDGNYTLLNVPNNATLSISYIGMLTQK